MAGDLRLSDFDVLLVLVASFIHDIGKETKDYQQSIKEDRVKDHCPVEFEEIINLKNSVLEILKALSVNLQNQDLKRTLDVVFTSTAEHMKSEYNLARALKSLSNKDERDTRVVSLVRTADTIASLKKLDEANFHLPLLEGRAEVFYHKVARIRGLLTTVLHKSLESFAEQQGAEILLTYPDGTLYLGKKNNFRYVQEDKIIDEVEKALKDTIIEIPAWNRFGLRGVLEWHENQVLVTKFFRLSESDLHIRGIFLLHFANGTLGGLGFALMLMISPFVTSNVILAGVVYGIFLWAVTLIPIHKLLTGISPWRHPDGNIPMITSLVGHLVYGVIIGLLFSALLLAQHKA